MYAPFNDPPCLMFSHMMLRWSIESTPAFFLIYFPIRKALPCSLNIFSYSRSLPEGDALPFTFGCFQPGFPVIELQYRVI